MITNFDEETAPLNDLELKAASIIGRCMIHNHVGSQNAVNGEHIGKKLAENLPEFRKVKNDGGWVTYLSGPRIRKIINYLRTSGQVPFLIASSKGYYISQDPREIRDYIRSLKERESAIHNVTISLQVSFRQMYPNEPMAQQEIKL